MQTPLRHSDVALQIFDLSIYETLRVIWYHLYNLKHMKNNHGRVILLVKLQATACSFTKSITIPWVLFTLFKLYKWYQTAQKVLHMLFIKYSDNSSEMNKLIEIVCL